MHVSSLRHRHRGPLNPHYAATIGEVDEFKKEANGYFDKINQEAAELAKKEGIELVSKVVAGHEVKRSLIM